MACSFQELLPDFAQPGAATGQPAHESIRPASCRPAQPGNAKGAELQFRASRKKRLQQRLSADLDSRDHHGPGHRRHPGDRHHHLLRRRDNRRHCPHREGDPLLAAPR